MKIEALIYTRVSSKRQEEEEGGLESQEAICREFCQRKGLNIARVFRDTYTGGSSARNGISEMIAYVKARPTTQHVIVFDDISHLNRSLSNHLEVTTVLREKLGCVLWTPSRELKPDADSMLIENILASMAEHGRRKNAEQVKVRMRGQLLEGNWVFRVPYGYQRAGGKHGIQPTILSKEPHFSIVKEALQGFATGRFVSQADVARYLQGEPAFLKATNASSVRIQRVTDMLRNPFYTGQLEYPLWNVSLRKAQHPAAIDFETHLTIVRKLDGAKRVFGSNRDDDFPARGYLLCAECGGHITAGWSKGRKKPYVYYHCYGASCPSRKKSLPRDEVHEQIQALLETMEVREEALLTLQGFLAEALKLRNGAAQERECHYREELKKLRLQQDQLVGRMIAVDDEALFVAMQDRHRESQKQVKILESKLAKSRTKSIAPSELFEHARELLASPSIVWKKGILEPVRPCLRHAFQSPCGIDETWVFEHQKPPRFSRP